MTRWNKTVSPFRLNGKGGLSLLLALAVLVAPAPWFSVSGRSLSLGGETVEDLRAGRFYHGPMRVRVPFLGVSFRVPHLWRIRLPGGSEVVHMDSARKPGLGVFFILEEATPDALEARLNEPLAFEEAYVLDPTGPVLREGSRFSASYLHGNQVGRAVALLGPANQAMVYVLAGPDSEAQYYEELVADLANSTRFVSQDAMARLRTWYEHLSNMTLHTPAGSDSADHKHWHLCSDGVFLYEFRKLRITGTPGDSGFEESGTWHIELDRTEVTLVVQVEHTMPREYRLHREGETISLDDERFQRRVSRKCL